MKTHKKFLVVSAVAAVAALGLAGCGDDSDNNTSDDRQSSQSTESSPTVDDEDAPQTTDEGTADSPDDSAQSGSGAADADSVGGALAAVVAAEEEATGTAYELSEDDGSWEVDVAVGDRSHEITVTQDGTVTGTEEDDLDGDDRAALEAAKITLADAIETAAAAAPGGRLDDVSLEDDGRGFTWEVSFEDAGVDHEIHVDVVSGKVVSTTTDD